MSMQNTEEPRVKLQPILVCGDWMAANSVAAFSATNPATGQQGTARFPVSDWRDCERALACSIEAAKQLRSVSPVMIGAFLDGYADRIEARTSDLVEMAHQETGLPISPRLRDVELVRTITQLRQGASAAREGTWQRAVVDTKANIRSHFAPIGPVVIFGPNNFPFAFNGISGGDFVAAIAAGNSVIAKSHPLHPGTTQLLAQCAFDALEESGLPPGTVQMLYHVENSTGLRLVADERVGATSFTGSRAGGLRLKDAAERAGRLIYLEMSSLNPVVILPGALRERGKQMATELADSALAAAGQFCTSPNLVFVIGANEGRELAADLKDIYESRQPSVLLSSDGLEGLAENVQALLTSGATIVTGGEVQSGAGCRYQNTLLHVSGEEFMSAGTSLQLEAFGNSTMLVTTEDGAQLCRAIESLEGNLTGCIYSSASGADDELYGQVAEGLRFKVGRLLNDKMPTGVALSPAMNHGGPYPSTGHPGFTAVGIPASLLRFGALHCYDNVVGDRLPPALRDEAPNPLMWRCVDGAYKQGPI
jgi:alpha-ketoglutaric semialdehyde dehydrogenase